MTWSADGKLAAPPTYFETLTCLAFLYFREKRVDAAVLEVGLGGRLDATNVVEPLASVITTVSRDHQEYLGKTLGRIAMEKAGIIKPGIPVDLRSDREVSPAKSSGGRAREASRPLHRGFRESAAPCERKTTARGYRFRFRWRGRVFNYSPRLPGAHQGRNAAVAIVTALSLNGPWETPSQADDPQGACPRGLAGTPGGQSGGARALFLTAPITKRGLGPSPPTPRIFCPGR